MRCAKTRSAVEHLGIAEIVDHYEGIIRELDATADHRRPLLRRRVHADAARPRPRRRRRGRRLRTRQGPAQPAALHAAVGLARPQEPGQPAPAGRPDARGVPLRVHQHAHRGGVRGGLRALRRARPGPRALPGGARELQPARRQPGRLHERRPRAAAADRRRHGPRRAGRRRTPRTSSKYRKSQAITEYKEFPERSHYTLGQPGWEEVADFALDWALQAADAYAGAPAAA